MPPKGYSVDLGKRLARNSVLDPETGCILWTGRSVGSSAPLNVGSGEWTGCCSQCPARFHTRAELEEHEREHRPAIMPSFGESLRAYRARPEWRLMKWRKRIARFAHLALLLRQTA